MSSNLSTPADPLPDSPSALAGEDRGIPVRLATREITAAVVWTFAADVLIFRLAICGALARRQAELEALGATHWSEQQGSTRLLASRLADQPELSTRFANSGHRQSTLQRFKDYAMQWYGGFQS